MDDLRTLLKNNLDAIERRLRRACVYAERPRAAVTLVAVTKSVSAEVAALLPELGVTDLGESRPQELWHKEMVLLPAVRWHLVGHLQRNKVARTLPLTHLIHSVDSDRLLDALEAEAAKQERQVDVLLEVNASRQPNKHGFEPEEVPGLVLTLRTLQHVRVRGLMTMAAFPDDPEACRPTFATVRRLGEHLRGKLGPPHEPKELSMGMTSDFEVAVEEGATLVRIGSALFKGLPAARDKP